MCEKAGKNTAAGGKKGNGVLVQLVSNSSGVVQPQLRVQVMQLPWAAQQEAPHDGLCVGPSLHSQYRRTQHWLNATH